jgi:hypothetical protein
MRYELQQLPVVLVLKMEGGADENIQFSGLVRIVLQYQMPWNLHFRFLCSSERRWGVALYTGKP